MRLKLNASYCFLCALKALLLLALLMGIASAQDARAQGAYETKEEAQKKAGPGVVFKTPNGFMQAPLSEYKGTMFLNPKRPAGIFISYPNEGEKIEDLAIRARKTFARMFVHDANKELQWQQSQIPSHTGDKTETSTVNIYDDETQTIQITVYEREVNGLTFIYGYFGRKSKTSKNKDDSSDFLDKEGNGVKAFDEFWKSIQPGKESN